MSVPIFSRTDARAIDIAGIDAGLPVGTGMDAINIADGLEPEDIESALVEMGYEPAAPRFIANLIASGVLFDLSEVPQAVLDDEYDIAPEPVPGTTSTDAENFDGV